ncbi:MAG: ABC transporter permease [Streptosporangiaceae bacterium]
MSHPDRPGRGQAGTLTEPPAPGAKAGGSLAAFAQGCGLTQSAARPTFIQYAKNVWQRRHFIWAFASSKSISMYTSSKLGQLWQVLTPLLNAVVYLLIFGLLLGISKGIPDYIPWLVCGVFLFSFTQRSVTAGAKSIGGNLSLIRALHFPRATLPLAYTVVEFQQLGVAMGVLIVIVLSFGVPITLSWLLVLPLILLQLMFNIGLSMMVARIGAFTRDITQLIPFILRSWFYFSGVIYSLGHLDTSEHMKNHPWIKDVLQANPGYVYVELIRQNMIKDYRASPTSSHTEAGMLWCYAVVWAVVFLIVGFWWFYRAEERYGRG